MAAATPQRVVVTDVRISLSSMFSLVFAFGIASALVAATFSAFGVIASVFLFAFLGT